MVIWSWLQKTLLSNATDLNTGDVVAPGVEGGGGGGTVLAGAHAVVVVLADEHHWQVPQLGDVVRLVHLKRDIS